MMSTPKEPTRADSVQDQGNFLESSIKLFRYYKSQGEMAINQLSDEQVLRKPNPASNSIALIVHHLSGNMLSRFTDFLISDGEKPWRNREKEFEDSYADKEAMMKAWDAGWACVFSALLPLRSEDFLRIVYIRNEGQTVLEAIQRQLAHYASHIGQIVYQAKILKGEEFNSLSIPRGGSLAFNEKMFGQDKGRGPSTDPQKP